MTSEDWRRDYALETRQLIRNRLPYGVLFFIAVFLLAWALEHHIHPQNDAAYGYFLLSQSIVLVGAIIATRMRRYEPHTVEIVTGAVVIVCGLIAGYYIAVRDAAELLAMALVYLQMGTTVAVPWGVRGQLPVAAAAAIFYLIALATGIPTPISGSITFLGLVAVGIVAILGAYFLDNYRLQMVQQAHELQAANEALTNADSAKNDFIANVSHELRTPLATILGYTELLLDNNYGEVAPEMRETIERIERSATYLGKLINDLIDLSRIESGRLTIKMDTVDVSPLCHEMTAVAESLLHDRPVHFKVSVPDELTVNADGQRVHQILVNLVGNAVKYTEKGEIALRGRSSNGEVLLEVEDTGVGIPEAEQKSIFDAFFRGTRRANSGGAGLGLSVSIRLANLMGGTITVKSAPGQGSTFTLRLPSVRQ